jgi:hypothetical protein
MIQTDKQNLSTEEVAQSDNVLCDQTGENVQVHIKTSMLSVDYSIVIIWFKYSV